MDPFTTSMVSAAERVVERAGYNSALQIRLLQKVTDSGTSLPPVCSCAHSTLVSPLDPLYTSLCANNCALRRDATALPTALEHVLHAVGLVE